MSIECGNRHCEYHEQGEPYCTQNYCHNIQEVETCPWCGCLVNEGDTERPADYCSHDITYNIPRGYVLCAV